MRDAHELSASQYLVVKVRTTGRHGAPSRGDGAFGGDHAPTAEALDGRPQALPDAAASKPLMRGQLIVVRGIDTQFYIPPSGVDIVPDTSVDESGATLSAVTAQRLVSQMQQQMQMQGPVPQGQPPLPPAEPMLSLEDAEEGELRAQQNQACRGAVPIAGGFCRPPRAPVSASRRQTKSRRPPPAPAAIVPAAPWAGHRADFAARRLPTGQQRRPLAPPPANIDDMLSSDSVRKDHEREARQACLVRHAAVLGEKSSACSSIPMASADQVGPARVFPVPTTRS